MSKRSLKGVALSSKLIGVIVLVALITVIVLLIRPSSTSPSSTKSINVVAAENFWGNIASQLGGSRVQVTSIITDPNADPHLYESSAKNAAAVSGANVVIVNGLGYDDFMSRLLGASGSNRRQVITASQILNEPAGSNQHLWYDIERDNLVASAITNSYEAKDPAHKSDYQRNLAVFNQSLQPLIDLINEIKQRYGGAPVAYTEPVPGYLLADAGLSVKTPEGFAKSIEDGNEPNPSDTETMDNLMTSKTVKVLLYNSQATSPVTEHVKELAHQAGIPVIGVSETLPPQFSSFQAWQESQIKQLLAALGS